jgi:pentatricopeptide repeat protein
MHGYVSQGNLQKALDLFGGLKEADGKDGKTQVGASCYNSLFLGYIQERQWENCLSLYEEMDASGVEPLSSSYSGLVLASFEIGGKPHLVTFLQHLVESKACVSSETAELALKLLLPQVKKEEGFNGIRARLRKMMDDRTEFKDALLDLISAIRVAELEGEENAQKQGDPSSHSDRWTVVLANLLAGVKVECSGSTDN